MKPKVDRVAGIAAFTLLMVVMVVMGIVVGVGMKKKVVVVAEVLMVDWMNVENCLRCE